MTGPRRSDRLQRQLQAELGALIEGELDDPRIGNVVVTAVSLSKDLSHARVFVYSSDPEESHPRLLRGLDRARGFLRRQLSQRLSHLRRVPDLSFVFDTSVESGMRVDELLTRLEFED